MRKTNCVLSLLIVVTVGLPACGADQPERGGRSGEAASGSKPCCPGLGKHRRNGRSMIPSAALVVKRLIAGGRRERAREIANQAARRYLPGRQDTRLTAADYEALGQIFAAVGDGPAQKKTADRWYDTFESDESHRSSITASQLLSLGRLLGDPGKPASEDRIREVARFAESRMITEKSAGEDPTIYELTELEQLAALGDSSSLRQLTETYLTALSTEQGRFRKELAPFEIARLAGSFSRREDMTSLKKLARFVNRDYLGESEIADAIRPHEWIDLVKVVRDSGDSSSARAMLGVLLKRVEEDLLPVGDLNHHELTTLAATILDFGGEPILKESLASQWLGLQGGWAALDGESRNQITEAIFGGPGAFEAFSGRLESRNATRQLTWAQHEAAAALVRRLGSRKTVRTWALGSLDRFISDDDAEGGSLQWVVELLGDGRIHLDRARAEKLTARLAALELRFPEIDDSIWKGLEEILRGRRPALEAHLVRPGGQVNLPIAKVLARSRLNGGSIRFFFQVLTERRADTEGDLRAGWELARAYAAELLGRYEQIGAGGANYIDLALAAAESDSMRVRCLEEMTAIAGSGNGYTKSLQAIASIEGQFTGAEGTRLSALRRSLEQRRAEYRDGRRRAAASRRWRDVFDGKRRVSGARNLATAKHRRPEKANKL